MAKARLRSSSHFRPRKAADAAHIVPPPPILPRRQARKQRARPKPDETVSEPLPLPRAPKAPRRPKAMEHPAEGAPSPRAAA